MQWTQLDRMEETNDVQGHGEYLHPQTELVWVYRVVADGSAHHGGLTSLLFSWQGSRGAKGAKVSL